MLTNPHNFRVGRSNKWNPPKAGGPRYSSYVNNTLKPHLQSQLSPPYYQGSYGIFNTTDQNKIGDHNLANGPDGVGFSANVNLASPLPKFGTEDVKYSQLSKEPEEFRAATIRKPVNFGRELDYRKVGARNKVGRTLLDDTVSDLDRIVSNHTNATDGQSLGKIGASIGAGLASNLGVPLLGQGLGSVAAGFLPPTYNSVPFNKLGKSQFLKGIIQDFRSRKGFGSVEDFIGKRLDGAQAAATIGKGKARAIAYAAASIAPGGAYSLFNRESIYGEGNAGSTTALRTDFTAKSNVTTKWNESDGEWEPTKNLLQKAVEFRGDKINVIDFKQGSLGDVYKWKPKKGSGGKGLLKKIGEIVGDVLNDPGVTQDFIKFYFTGPSIQFGDTDTQDDLMVFRAVITSLTDTYNPQWNPSQMIGRADPTYHYSGYSRDMNLDFTVAAHDRDELKPIWRKLNQLASYTAPEYNKKSIAMKGPWMRVTIGDLLVQQPVFISSLFFTLVDTETTWDINIENDPTRMQVPNKIQVSMGLTIITDYLPQKGGRMYTLAKTLDGDTGIPKTGDDNWLSDTKKSNFVSTVEPETLIDEGTITAAIQTGVDAFNALG